MFKFLENLFKSKKRQSLSVFCKECRNDLCADDSFISDTYDDNGDNHVKYKCSKCGLESDFNFDLAPCPINWNDINGKNK